MTCSRRSCSASPRSLPPSRAHPSSARAGAASSPTPSSDAASASATAATLLSSDSSTDFMAFPFILPWTPLTVFLSGASPCSATTATTSSPSDAAMASCSSSSRSVSRSSCGIPSRATSTPDHSPGGRDTRGADRDQRGSVPRCRRRPAVPGGLGDGPRHRRALAVVYSSRTGSWGDLISTPVHGSRFFTIVTGDALLAGDSLYWVLAGNLDAILEFDLEKQSLAVIQVPMDVRGRRNFKLMRAEGGGLGFLFISDSDRGTAKLWKRVADCDGIASWVLVRTIELDKLLSLDPEEEERIAMLAFAENNNVLLLWTVVGVFMIHLESLKFKKLFETMYMSHYHPFGSVYTAGYILVTEMKN